MDIIFSAVKNAQLKKAAWEQLVQSVYFPSGIKMQSVMTHVHCMVHTAANPGVQLRMMRMEITLNGIPAAKGVH